MLARRSLPVQTGIDALAHLVRATRNSVPFIDFSNVPASSWTGQVLLGLHESLPQNTTVLRKTDTYAVVLPKSIEEYLNGLGERSRRDFHYDLRRLKREYEVEFKAHRKVSEECLQAIEKVDKARWGSVSGYGVRGYREFERSVARALADRGNYLAVLYLNGQAAAFLWGAVLTNRLMVDRVGHDPGIAPKLSIGKVTNSFSIQYAIEQGLELFDLTRGAESYKKWLGATARTNLHLRIYRTPFDRWLTKRCSSVLAAGRASETVRYFFHALQGRR
jgi:CelD/BcsL family acetyltransferase involved in cellulose biosynthesis